MTHAPCRKECCCHVNLKSFASLRKSKYFNKTTHLVMRRLRLTTLIFLIISVIVIYSDDDDIKIFKIQVSKWDIRNVEPVIETVEKFLGFNEKRSPDVLAIGLQGSSLKDSSIIVNEVLQDNLSCGFSPLDFLFKFDWECYENWGIVIETILQNRNYFRIGKVEMPGVLLAVYAKEIETTKIKLKKCLKATLLNENPYPFMGVISFTFEDKDMTFVSTQLPINGEEEIGSPKDFELIYWKLENMKFSKNSMILFGPMNLEHYSNKATTIQSFQFVTPKLI